MKEIKIENIVATTTLADHLDLKAIQSLFKDAEYDSDKFPGLIYHMKKPKTATLLFSSGKAVCTGAKSVEEARESISKIISELKRAGFKVKTRVQITIQNIVATHDLNTEINLNALAISLGFENIEYEPEQFPGLVYRIRKPRVVALLFSSGKIVCTGAKDPSDVEKAIDILSKELSGVGYGLE
jgi:transcription initiation factor TFIID TATA-box-binding protein